MKTYKEMNREEIGRAYDNTGAVSNSSEILNIYEQKSDIVRKSSNMINIKYGEKERQNIDYFHTKDNAPLLFFIHGGYWQMRRKENFHFLVESIAKKGYNVAFVGYTLAPENDIRGIEAEISLGLKKLREEADKLLFDKDKIVLSGWSAGGHLSVEMLGEEGVVSAIAISGIYDIDPISKCFLNDKLNINDSDIIELSPMRKTAPKKKVHLVYGELELSELIRQSIEYHEYNKNSTLRAITGANHFTILLDESTFSALDL